MFRKKKQKNKKQNSNTQNKTKSISTPVTNHTPKLENGRAATFKIRVKLTLNKRVRPARPCRVTQRGVKNRFGDGDAKGSSKIDPEDDPKDRLKDSQRPEAEKKKN